MQLDPNAISIEGLVKKPIRLIVARPTAIYAQSDMQRALGEMLQGTQVELVALTDNSYRVRGRAKHGGVAGWMRREDLTSADPELHSKLKKLYERQVAVEEMIAKKQIAIGMTPEEVRASLGKPSRKYSRTTVSGREESLEYILYENVPQTATGYDRYGNLVQSVIYVKVETGRLTVNFENGFVSEIEETKGNPLGSGGVKIVPPPLYFY